MEEQKKKKKERQLKVKGKKSSKKVVETNDKGNIEDKIKCAACTEYLNSDTDDEENKNIGCDHCTKWFHLRWTEIGLSYEEAAAQEYSCYSCS